MRIKSRPRRLLPSKEQLLERHRVQMAVALEKRRRERAALQEKKERLNEVHVAETLAAESWRNTDPDKYAALRERQSREREELQLEVWQLQRKHNNESSKESRARKRDLARFEHASR